MAQQLSPQFREKLLELAYLQSTLCVLEWDKLVNVPKEGQEARTAASAYLTTLRHKKLVSPEFEGTLMQAKELMDSGALEPDECCIVRETLRGFEKEKRLPTEFVTELARVCGEAYQHWVEARKNSDFAMFAPDLKKIVGLKREEAKLLGFESSPYDALIDNFEPYTTSAGISQLFSELKAFLVEFITRIKGSRIKINGSVLRCDCPVEEQSRFVKMVAREIGYNFNAGRLDTSVHPFSISFHPTDARITSRWDRHNIMEGITSVVHESGHSMYEQGLLAGNYGTPMGEYVSLGIHESQSRMWENIIGRSRHFWRYFYPRLRKTFPAAFGATSLEVFYRALNSVKPSLIRTDADEATYNLHIILRFEIEKALIEGSIEVEDLPSIWNRKVKEYLGIRVPNDAKGVLQDIHWSGGSFGYFPTYALGNLYAAQFYAAARKDMPDLEKEIARGRFDGLHEWLKKSIYVHGKLFSASELAQRVTGEGLNSKYFINYISQKYSEIYGL